MSGMQRETLRMHLTNEPLVQAIRQKIEIDKTRKELHNALVVMEKVGINGDSLNVVKEKIKEYANISKNYVLMIEDTWNITS